MRFQRRPPLQGARAAAPVDLERKRRAEELSTRSGIPLQMAYSVVDGHTTLDAVLKGMLARDKTRKLAEQYGLPPSLAGQVARGQVPLDKVLARHRRRTSPQWRARFSIFDAYASEPGRAAILRFGQDWAEGSISSVGKYDFVFDSGSGPQTLLKHEVKILLPMPDALPAAREAISSDPTVVTRGLGATAELAERLKLDKEQFYDTIRSGNPVQFVFRDGDLLRGPVVWFARYEFALAVGEGRELVGFFHALLDWSVPRAPEAEKDRGGAKGAKHKQPPKKGKRGHR